MYHRCCGDRPLVAALISIDVSLEPLRKADVGCARSLGRDLLFKTDVLAHTQVRKVSLDGAVVEEIFLSSVIADEPEAFVLRDPCNGSGGHIKLLVHCEPSVDLNSSEWYELRVVDRANRRHLRRTTNGHSLGRE